MATTVSVNTPSGQYEVHIGSGLLKTIGAKLTELGLGKKIAVIADQAVSALYSPALLESLREAGFTTSLTEVASGEPSKDIAVYAKVLSYLAQQRLDRQSTVIALGGGVIGDLTGFVAASYLRGVNFVQVPTTLLAMVDSSVGGKTGINLPEGKNLVGAFYQPRLVLADVDTLLSLPQRELSGGMAEIIKHGIIADPELFQQVASGVTGSPEKLASIIQRNVEIKAAVVSQDERETSGKRALLNFGHTIGHAIEAAAGYGSLHHGEAVSIGIRAAAHLSHAVLKLPMTEVRRIEAALAANKLPLHFAGSSHEKLAEIMGRDKKVKAGKINWVLTPRIGEAIVIKDVPPDAVDYVFDLIRTPPVAA